MSSKRAFFRSLLERGKVAAKRHIETQALFFSVRDRHAGAGRGSLNVRSVHGMLLHITKVRGLPTMHTHLLRDACATHMLDNGCPLDVISQILGHDSLDVTAHYAQVSTRLMMQTYRSAHPHARTSR
jgi:site-specific recombinase XerD